MKRKITIKNIELGSGNAKICVPMIGKNEEEVEQELIAVLEANPDVVEWRADYLEEPTEENILNLLYKINRQISDYPIIFTLRIDQEGGQQKIPQDERLRIIQKVVESRKVDLVDVELINGPEFIQAVLDTAHQNQVYVIVSNHHFKSTPTQDEIIQRLKTIQQSGCDICKIACMPCNQQDVLTLLAAADIFNENFSVTPVIAISMSEKGLISRVAAGVFGSCLTFGIAKYSSAPGQISVSDLRAVMAVLG